MTTAEREALDSAIRGIDNAMTWLDADVRRLQQALDAGVSLEVIGELNRIIYREGEK